jgi:all-trans-retinol dehydrogenase (NAD+)
MGLIGGARLTDYCASKWALLGLAESLRLELARDGLAGELSVVSLAPYATATGMFSGIFSDARDRNALREALFPQLRPAQVAAAILTAVRAGGNALVVLPASAGVAFTAARAILPLAAFDLLVGWCGGWHGMSSFKGRAGAAEAQAADALEAQAVVLMAEARRRADVKAAAVPQAGGRAGGVAAGDARRRSRGASRARKT